MNRTNFECALPVESGGGPPHSKTLERWPQSRALPPGFELRRPCGALDFPDRFMDRNARGKAVCGRPNGGLDCVPTLATMVPFK